MNGLLDALETEAPDVPIAADPGQPSLLPPRENILFLGHEDVERNILMDIHAGRLPHAVILAGPEGIGKATLAFRLAKYLFVEQGTGDDLFGDAAPATSLASDITVPAVRRVASGGHADLLTIERPFDEAKGEYRKDIPVDLVRKCSGFLRKTASEGGWRIVIVDGADYMNRSSQNALLKILEEPPEKALLVLVANQPGAFLPTIRSRCRLIPMMPLPENTVISLLQKGAPDLSVEDCSALARLSEGSIGRALELYKEGGIELYLKLLESLKSMPQVDYEEVYALADMLNRKGAAKSCEIYLRLMVWWLARLALSVGQSREPDAIVEQEGAVIKRFVNNYTPKEILDLWQNVDTLANEMNRASLDRGHTIIRIFGLFEK